MKKQIEPLRKILGRFLVNVGMGSSVGITSTTKIPKEVYECGHVRTSKLDIYGETNAYRRRCYACKLNKPKDIEIEPNATFEQILKAIEKAESA